jgi:hypothetical protein
VSNRNTGQSFRGRAIAWAAFSDNLDAENVVENSGPRSASHVSGQPIARVVSSDGSAEWTVRCLLVAERGSHPRLLSMPAWPVRLQSASPLEDEELIHEVVKNGQLAVYGTVTGGRNADLVPLAYGHNRV